MFHKICQQCGKAFSTKRRYQVNCSVKCGYAAGGVNRIRRVVLSCPCGKTVERIPSLKHMIFCSRKCRIGADEARHQQRRRPKPTPEQRAALMREWILDMRAAEKHARLGG